MYRRRGDENRKDKHENGKRRSEKRIQITNERIRNKRNLRVTFGIGKIPHDKRMTLLWTVFHLLCEYNMLGTVHVSMEPSFRIFLLRH